MYDECVHISVVRETYAHDVHAHVVRFTYTLVSYVMHDVHVTYVN